jgi:CheY-like chemotaxis protein
MTVVDAESRFHVLAVDDSIIDRKLIEMLLKNRGCRASVREVCLSAGVTKLVDSRSTWNRAPQRATVP